MTLQEAEQLLNRVWWALTEREDGATAAAHARQIMRGAGYRTDEARRQQ